MSGSCLRHGDISLLTERRRTMGDMGYKHLAPLEQRRSLLRQRFVHAPGAQVPFLNGSNAVPADCS